MDSRAAAIASLARLDKQNKEITQQIASYLNEPYFNMRWSVIHALGARGDATAVPALEALLKRDDLSIEMVPEIKDQIERLQLGKQAKKKKSAREEDEEALAEQATMTRPRKTATPRLSRNHQPPRSPGRTNRTNVAARLKSMESHMPAQTQSQQ